MTRLKITGKLMLGALAILSCLGAVVTWYSITQFRRLLYGETMRRVEAQTLNWIEANFSSISLSRDPRVLDRLVQELARLPGISYVVLTGERGEILASFGPVAGLQKTDAAPGVSGVKGRLCATRNAAGVAFFEFAAPIAAGGTGMNPEIETLFEAAAPAQELGQVRVGVAETELQRRTGSLVVDTITLYAILILFALLLQGLVARKLVAPISALAEVANQIAAGNFALRVEQGVRLRNEVGDLVRNFNQMARRLAEGRDEMDRLHAGLEQMVRERTAELEQANLRLQELDQLKSKFLSTVSHELQSPLTSIKAYGELLLDSPGPDPATREHFLQIIGKETDRLSRMISELLDLARIEGGAVVWKIVPADLSPIVHNAVSAMASLASEKGLRLEAPPLPLLPVVADADRLQQVLTNLIANAVKFCPPGSFIRVWCDELASSGPHQNAPGRYVRVAVADDGPGIAPEDIPQVFEKFYQAGEDRPGSSGTGLGLAISREIVHHHGGEIWVQSELGRGSTFYFTVPRYDQSRNRTERV